MARLRVHNRRELKVRKGGHARAKMGKKQSLLIDAWPRPGARDYIYCKVSVHVGLRNESCDLRMPFLSVNPPRVACLNPVRALMNHVMLSLRHQLARQELPALLTSPLLPRRCRPSPSSSLFVPVLRMPPSSPHSPHLKSSADVARLCWSVPQVHVPQISVKPSHFA